MNMNRNAPTHLYGVATRRVEGLLNENVPEDVKPQSSTFDDRFWLLSNGDDWQGVLTMSAHLPDVENAESLEELDHKLRYLTRVGEALQHVGIHYSYRSNPSNMDKTAHSITISASQLIHSLGGDANKLGHLIERIQSFSDAVDAPMYGMAKNAARGDWKLVQEQAVNILSFGHSERIEHAEVIDPARSRSVLDGIALREFDAEYRPMIGDFLKKSESADTAVIGPIFEDPHLTNRYVQTNNNFTLPFQQAAEPKAGARAIALFFEADHLQACLPYLTMCRMQDILEQRQIASRVYIDREKNTLAMSVSLDDFSCLVSDKQNIDRTLYNNTSVEIDVNSDSVNSPRYKMYKDKLNEINAGLLDKTMSGTLSLNGEAKQCFDLYVKLQDHLRRNPVQSQNATGQNYNHG